MAEQKNPADLTTERNTLFADNTMGGISALDGRTVIGNLQESAMLRGTNIINNTFLPMVGADGQTVTQSSISEGDDNISMIKRCTIVPSEFRIGSTGLRTAGDILYLSSSRTGRQFLPVGSTFTDSGTSGFIGVSLGALETITSAQQDQVGDTMALSAGQSYSFVSVGTTGQDHLLKEATIRISGTATIRLRFFVGTDDTGDLVLDETYTLTDGDNVIASNALPYLVDGQSYFVMYTAVTAATIVGSGSGTAFRPYFIPRGWPYSETNIEHASTLDDAYGQGNDITITDADGPVILDASGADRAPLRIVAQSTVPETSPEDGDIFYKDNTNNLYVYEGGRDKWLSITTHAFHFARSGATDNTYLEFEGITNIFRGPIMPFDGTIVGITASGEGNLGKNIAIVSGTTALAVFQLSNGTYNNQALNIDVDEGSVLRVLVSATGAPVINPIVSIYIKWREVESG